jgi:hypothetical protein
MGAAVLSHWVLDLMVHVPELPLGGETAAKVGLGLWNVMPPSLMLEGLYPLEVSGFCSGETLSSRGSA